MFRPLRVVLLALASALLLEAGGTALEYWRFGAGSETTVRHLEAAVRDTIASNARRVDEIARRVVEEAPSIVSATRGSRDELASLFELLAGLTGPDGDDRVTVTVYVPAGQDGFRVLAWSDGPAGEIARPLLSEAASLVVAPGPAGLRLIGIRPVEQEGRRIAVVAAEKILTADTRDGTPVLETAFGPVDLIAPDAAAGRFAVKGFAIERPRLDVRFSEGDLESRRTSLRQLTNRLAGLPLVLALLALTGPLLGRRRFATAGHRVWISVQASGLVWLAAGLLHTLLAGLQLPAVAQAMTVAAGMLATVAIVGGGLWWQRLTRRFPAEAPTRFALEHLAVGSVIAAALFAEWGLVSTRLTSQTLPSWHSALFPFDLRALLDVWTVLFLQLALGWAAGLALAWAAERWRLSRLRGWTILGVGCWIAPALLAASIFGPSGPPHAPAAVVLAALILFGLSAASVRGRYRRATQSLRLVWGFLALVLPLAALYPLLAAAVDRATQRIIEDEYAPQAARQSDDIRAILRRVQDEIDALPLIEQVRQAARPPVDSQTAFYVWNHTSLRSTRLVSDVELYGADHALISRFAFNYPEYVARTTSQRWQGTGCAWEAFGEVTRFGSSTRTMLHAQRGLCDADGALAGAVVIHVAPTDYEALPFVASASPYADLWRAGGLAGRTDQGPPDLHLVVYGWSLQPLFTSDESVAWTIDDALFTRIYREGASFWTSMESNDRPYRVFIRQNRAGIYALGYPAPSAFDHAARLAELVAIAALVFVVLQAVAVVYLPLVHHTSPPLRVLLQEVRTSFYRKLFLFFVLVAVGPVLLLALAIGGFMQARFRDDIQNEAASIVAVARRVFEQITVAEQTVAVQPTDDLMVWIRQVIDEDVHLFEGASLVATSQRDLINSGLLPTRTPATVYRNIALARLPSFVTEDQQYLVAATPVPGLGRDAILSVPLAPRQQEIEREIDDLNRRVLVGSVLIVLFAAGLGASLAGRVADPVSRLTKAARRIATGQLDVRIAVDTADELKRLVDDFNTMTARLLAQRAELARANQLKAWHEMARQVAHEIKNPLTPIQLAAEHLERVHADRGLPLGDALTQCTRTILSQVKLLRQIASEFANFASEPTSRPERLDVASLLTTVVDPYRRGLNERLTIDMDVPEGLAIWADRTLLARALTNLVENAIQAMPSGGTLGVRARADGHAARVTLSDTGVGMDAETLAHAFEPFFSTKTGGSGLGLANAKRTIEREGGELTLSSHPGVGTTASITLPLSEAPRDGSAGVPAPSR